VLRLKEITAEIVMKLNVHGRLLKKSINTIDFFFCDKNKFFDYFVV